MNPVPGSFLKTGMLAVAAVATGCGSDQLIDAPTEPSFLLSPKAPSNTSAVAVAYDAIRVTWRDNSTNESGFQVYRSTTGSTGTFSLRATRLADATRFRDTQVAPLKSYCYKVRAFRTKDGTTSYSAFSNIACATTPASPLPAAPSAIVAKPVSSTSVRTTWSDKSSNEDGFRVERSTDGGATWTTAGTVGPNITAFRDNGRTSEQPVCYRVVAFNEYGNSAASNTDCTTPPAAPTNLTASAAAQGGINLTWVDNSSAEDGYQVQRSTDGTTFSTIANLAVNATTYSDAGATGTTSYWYRVRAKKDGGFSGNSNTVVATAASLPPAAPSQVNAQPWSSRAINISWQAGSVNAESFRVERSTDNGSSWIVAGNTEANDWTLLDDGRTPEQQVCYRVIAVNSAGDSPPSTVDCTAPPSGPTDLTFTVLDIGVQFTWSDNSAVEDGFVIMPMSADYGYYGEGVTLPPNSTTYLSTGNDDIFGCRVDLAPPCYIAVVAIKDGGYSDWSNMVAVP